MERFEITTQIIASIALITGVLLLLAPKVLVQAGELFNRVYNLESLVYAWRKPFGLIFILGGSALIYFLW